jgi:hypothetical protein
MKSSVQTDGDWTEGFWTATSAREKILAMSCEFSRIVSGHFHMARLYFVRTKWFVSLLLLLCLAAFSQFQASAGVVISEFLAANNNGLRDEDGTASDWIEIHNADTNLVNLAGWRLTDEADNSAKWIFPATNLPPGEFIVVFASSKNRVTVGNPLHTSFSLSAAGEYLALIEPDGSTVASEYAPAFPPQLDNVSYGLTPTNVSLQKFFAILTPGETNSTSYFTQAAEPQCHPERGFYSTNISVTITSATPAAIIRYTFDGTPPTETSGTIYTNPITVTETTALRAAAFLPDATPSPVATHTYIFVADVVTQSLNGEAPEGWPLDWGNNMVDYGLDPDIVNNPPWAEAITNTLISIPSISLVLPLESLFDFETGIYANPGENGIAWERATSVELLNPAGDKTKQFQINGGLRIRGGYSRSLTNPKHSFRVILRSTYGASRLNYPFFGPTAATSFDKFDLRSHQDDSWHFFGTNGEFIRDAFSRDSQLALGRVATHGDFYHLYLNGQYWGLFSSEERPDASFGASYFGGDKINYDTVKVDVDDSYAITTTDGDLAAWLRLWQAATNGLETIAAYQKIQGNNPDGTPNSAFENLLDVPGLIDYMLVILYTGNIDAPISSFLGNDSPNNWYGLRETNGATGGFRFVMHDSENSLYSLNANRTGPFPAGDPAQGSDFTKSNPQYLWQQLSANEEFRVLVGDHVQRHFFNEGALTVTAIINRYQARRNEIDLAVIAESARWGDAKREPPFTYDDWRTASDGLLTNYFPYRTAIVINQLRPKNLFPNLGAPAMNQFGGSIPTGFQLTLSHTNPAGAIYFTTDGNDPRLPGGTIAPTAQAYETDLTIAQPTRIRARVKSDASWSALSDATFTPPQDLSKLALTEVMYNPPIFNAISGNDLEFLEFKNVGTNTLNLSSLTFSAGLTFTFPNNTLLASEAFLVLARNSTAFNTKYPGVPVYGTYTGQLDNSGENLTLSFPLGGTVFSFTYDDQAPWPITPDGRGFSLVPKQPGLTPAPDAGAKWRASAQPGGSPGTNDPVLDIPPIVINEVLTHTDLPLRDAIELYNPTDADVDVSGWYLTDNSGTPNKYQILAPSIIPAGGFLLFDDSQFNTGTDGNVAFAFSSTGEEVYLTSANTNEELTGYSHGFVFGAVFNGVSFGRYVNSAGEELFPVQSTRTFGTTNASPAVGPIVINEIHFHPASLADDEFVELLNTGDGNVPLFHPVFSTNTWRINGIGYVFPTNIQLAPAERLLVVSIDPDLFRAKYGVATNVQIFGPYPGALDNSGERLTLEGPDNPNLGVTPYVIVEEVRYNDKSPWPNAADGSGPSLQRVSALTFGNDPVNWSAAAPTPGEFSPNADSDGDGMPDDWEIGNELNWKANDASADSDQDGLTNLEEYLSGTLPQNAASGLRLQIFAGPTGTNCCPWLELEAVATRSYSVMFCSVTNLGDWVKFADIAATTTNRLVQIPITDLTDESRFFKVTTPALP